MILALPPLLAMVVVSMFAVASVLMAVLPCLMLCEKGEDGKGQALCCMMENQPGMSYLNDEGGSGGAGNGEQVVVPEMKGGWWHRK